MKKIILFTFFLSAITIVFGQDTAKIDLKQFYFPYEKINKTVAYVYRNVNDSSETFTWHIQRQRIKKDTLLIIRVFNSKNQIIEETMNRIRPSGVSLISYKTYIYRRDSLNILSHSIIDSDSYSFSQRPEELITWQIRNEAVAGGKGINLRKDRSFSGFVAPLDAMKFEDKYYYIVEGNEMLNHQVKAYYRKDIGLVRYSVMDKNGVTKLFVLDNQRYSKAKRKKSKS